MNRDDVSWLAELADYANNDCNDPSWLISFANLVAAHEREECAQIGMHVAHNGIEVSAAIRARGNQ